MTQNQAAAFFFDHINKQGNEVRQHFTQVKKNSKFFYANVIAHEGDDPAYFFAYHFSDKLIEEADFLNMVEEPFRTGVRALMISQEEQRAFSESFYRVNTEEMLDWEYRRGTYQELLDAPVLHIEKGVEGLMDAVANYMRMDKHELGSGMYHRKPENISLEVIYQKADNNFEYGDITARVVFNGEVIGHYNRSGRYMDTYTYYTHDRAKWNAMMDCIVKEYDIKPEEDDSLSVFSKEDDIYTLANIPGYHDVEGSDND